ncbi:hypothetical protein [Streptomyces tanashiensis]|uniref:hypothetical protein n=1 Tax=Streptomyces tanashiensis TaxID=67367 RepID=UPI001E55F3FB|nr:hypothetical protein [Streptomyces tanashiensis]
MTSNTMNASNPSSATDRDARVRLRTRRRSRAVLASLLALPVLSLAVACGTDAGVKDAGVATVPDEPTASAATPSGSGDGGSSAAGGKGAFYDAQMTYVRCMRGKGGVKEFPDPKLSGYLDWTKIDELSPTYPEVSKGGKNGVCVAEMTAASQQEPERDTQTEYESMLAHAQCMRSHGVSRFQNPTMSGGNVIPGGDPNPASPSFDRDSPAYKQAVAACKDKLLDGLDGMQ